MRGQRKFLIKVSGNNFILDSAETRTVSLQFNETAGARRGLKRTLPSTYRKVCPSTPRDAPPPPSFGRPRRRTLLRPPVHYIMHAHNSIHSRHEHNNNKVTFTFCRMDERRKKKGLKLLVALRKRGKNSDELRIYYLQREYSEDNKVFPAFSLTMPFDNEILGKA